LDLAVGILFLFLYVPFLSRSWACFVGIFLVYLYLASLPSLILSHEPLDSQPLALMNHLQFQKYDVMNAMGSNSSTVDVGRCTMMSVHEMDVIISFSYWMHFWGWGTGGAEWTKERGRNRFNKT
jgi:hypothetical protein